MSNSKAKAPSIAARLRLAREQAGLSQGQVAKLLELHRPSISEMEAGRRRVSAEELTKLAEIYDVSIEWLTGTNVSKTDSNYDKVELAARELSKLKEDDLERVLQLLAALRKS